MVKLQYINDTYASYLHFQIGSSHLEAVKQSLQDICKLYQCGYRLKPKPRNEIEIAVVGHLNASTHDHKVRRWCLNVLSVIGTLPRSKSSIEAVLEKCQNDPDTISAALTAYFKVENNAYNLLIKKDIIRNELIILAAIKGGFIDKIETAHTAINIDNADSPVLRSALLGVGLGLAPEHIFHPRYTNSELVGKLSQHNDELVSQYSVWAVAENPNLTASHLGVDIKQIDDLPGNVRGWIYRLYAEQSKYSNQRHDLIVRGSEDNFEEARRNLALGLRDEFYDGLQEVTCPWYYEEGDAIKPLIADHMIKNSQKCNAYNDQAKRIFCEASIGSQERRRMLAMSAGTTLYSDFKRIDLQGQGDLFAVDLNIPKKEKIVINNTYNIETIQAGAVSIGGDAKNQGNIENTFTGDQLKKIGLTLDELHAILDKLPLENGKVAPVLELVAEAKKAPTPSTIGKIVSAVKQGTDFSGYVASLGDNLSKISTLVANLVQYIPMS